MNDGQCDPAGRFWTGSIVMDKSGPNGALYRVEADLSTSVVRTGVSVSNGLGWSPDATTMYFIDSMSGGVDAYRYDRDSGEVTERRRFVDVDFEHGEPDGLTVDADGCVWFAIWRAGEMRRYTPDGELDTLVRVPASLTTSCCFGGARSRHDVHHVGDLRPHARATGGPAARRRAVRVPPRRHRPADHPLRRLSGALPAQPRAPAGPYGPAGAHRSVGDRR